MTEHKTPAWKCAILVGHPLLSRPPDHFWADRRLICTAATVPYALAHDLTPDAVIGPLTALEAHHRQRLHQAQARVLTPPDTTPQTALELALNYAITTGARDILLMGLVGERLADSLGNLLLLARAEWGAARLTFIHGDETGYLLRHGEAAVINGQTNDLVALLPLSPTATEITTQGLAPALRNISLELGRTEHLRLVESPARVWLGAGRLLVIHEG